MTSKPSSDRQAGHLYTDTPSAQHPSTSHGVKAYSPYSVTPSRAPYCDEYSNGPVPNALGPQPQRATSSKAQPTSTTTLLQHQYPYSNEDQTYNPAAHMNSGIHHPVFNQSTGSTTSGRLANPTAQDTITNTLQSSPSQQQSFEKARVHPHTSTDSKYNTASDNLPAHSSLCHDNEEVPILKTLNQGHNRSDLKTPYSERLPAFRQEIESQSIPKSPTVASHMYSKIKQETNNAEKKDLSILQRDPPLTSLPPATNQATPYPERQYSLHGEAASTTSGSKDYPVATPSTRGRAISHAADQYPSADHGTKPTPNTRKKSQYQSPSNYLQQTPLLSSSTREASIPERKPGEDLKFPAAQPTATPILATASPSISKGKAPERSNFHQWIWDEQRYDYYYSANTTGVTFIPKVKLCAPRHRQRK